MQTMEEIATQKEVNEKTITQTFSLEEIPSDEGGIIPYVIIGERDGKLGVFLNKKKLFHTLSEKNLICTALDVRLVDEIQTHLSDMKALEKSNEQVKK